MSGSRGRWRSYGLHAAVAIAVLALDQVTKSLVRQHLPLNQPTMLIPSLDRLFTFRHVQNTGAAFGLFPGGATVFMGIAVLVVIGIIVYLGRLERPAAVMRVALGMMLGGAVGNLVDRLTQDGAVTDFIDFRWFPIFNLADASITVGTILLAWYLLFREPAQAAAAQEENRTPTAADWKRLSARWRDALDARINSLIRLRDQLDGCIGCGCLSLKACPLRNPWDELAGEGPGARLLEGNT